MYDISSLIETLSKIPGIGRKSAGRIAYFLLKEKKRGYELARVIDEVLSVTISCEICGNYTAISPCKICSDSSRDQSVICVVEDQRDLLAIEETCSYKGVYHILSGALNPLAGITPDNLRIKELAVRLNNRDIKEVLIATNPTIDGEATFLYIQKILADYKSVKISRIATGIPMGGNLEYTDKTTLVRALASKKYI